MLTTINKIDLSISSPPSQDSDFFLRLALFITVFVFSGFIVNWIVNPENLGRVTLWIGLHGTFSAAWYLLLLNQLRLSRSGHLATHKRLGKLSALLVIAIIVTGMIMVLDLYQRLVDIGMFNPSDEIARTRAGGLIGSTFLQWAIFAILFVMGILNVRTPTHHKRFMLAAAIQMMPEGLNRFIHLLGLPGYAMLIMIFLIYLSIITYDWKTERRLHWSTLFSLGLFVLLATSIYTVFRSQVWGDWVVKMLSGI
ncbi:hypothetical protein [Aliikangiella sp. G2MR2-5]|uniref:hypothetical protein n=1 Tax=Aliikangiella sp. G2MR2-5 TaxID=2788943 RepID=UPI0018A92532|nr:hypothetical protein [Aliikangiella sp. G2MR2-5]